MALACARRLLPTVIAQIIQQLGWDAVHQSVMDVLVDILDRNLADICRKVHFFAELDGRTDPSLDDLNMAFTNLGVNLTDLLGYLIEVEPSSLVVEVPQFPLSAEKMKSLLNAEKKPRSNGMRTNNQTKEDRTEVEEGSRTVAPVGPGTVTTPGAMNTDKKSFTNDAATSKRLRHLPDEAMQSQYEMKGFLVSDSGSFIPIRPGIRASTGRASPSPPRRLVQPSPTLPACITERIDVIGECEIKTTLEPEALMFLPKDMKRPGKLPKDGVHRLLKHSVKKQKKLSHVGASSGMSKLPKLLKSEKTLPNKSKPAGKKVSSDNSTSRMLDRVMKEKFPGDITQASDGVPPDREQQMSRIRSYEDSINTVVQNSSQNEVRFDPDEFCDASVLPAITRQSIGDDGVCPVDNFYRDLGAPSPPPPSQLFDHHTTERDAHINSAIDDVIKASSFNVGRGMSCGSGESDIEIEPKQSAVEDIFDVSSVPSPIILTTWPPVIEEEVIIEEPIVVEEEDFTIPSSFDDRNIPIKKLKKLKSKAAEKVVHGFDTALKKSEEPRRKSKHHSVGPPTFAASSLDSSSGEESEAKSKTPLEQLTDFSEAPFSSNMNNWSKKSKYQMPDEPSVYTALGKVRDEEPEKMFRQLASDFDVFQPHIRTDEMHRKLRHHHANDDTAIVTVIEDKKPRHKSTRLTFSATPEPQRDTRDRSDEVFAARQDVNQPVFCDWPKVFIENVGYDGEKKMAGKKKPFLYSPSPPPRQSPVPYSASSSTSIPHSPLPPSLASRHVDASSLPPLKRIKIVSSTGTINQFEIKEHSQPLAEKDNRRDKKEKKKAKKRRERDRSRDRSRNYDRSNLVPTPYSRDREMKDSSKKDSFANLDTSYLFIEDKVKRKVDSATLQSNAVFADQERKLGKVSGNRHFQRPILESSDEDDFDQKEREDQFNISRSSSNLSDHRFAKSTEVKGEHRWKGEDWMKEKAHEAREKDVFDRERSKGRKKKERSRSRSRDEGKGSKKEDKYKEWEEKPVEKSEHKRKKSEKKCEVELPSEPIPFQLPTIPKITLKFGNSSAGTPSLSRTGGEPSHQPVLRTTEPPTNPPIKLRFKTGFSCLPNVTSSPSLGGQSLYGNDNAGLSGKVALQLRPGQPVLEMPTFSPSPESIFIPSQNDSSDSELSIVGRIRTPTPPSLSIPAPIMSRPRVPYYTSSSSSSSHSLSPPLLHLPKEVESRQASLSNTTRKSAAALQPDFDSRVVQTPKVETNSKMLKASSGSKGPSQKPKSSAKVDPVPKVSLHSKGMPPSRIMPPATPVQPLLPAAKTSTKSGSTKSKKRVTTETVSKVVNADGVITWICPACLVEDKGEEPMIGCDECDDWYHWRCVGVLVEPPEESSWYCRRCQVKSKVLVKTPSAGRGKGKKSKKK